jgi:CPA2 family monovalent cation:H+ antiporter-2
MTEALIHALLIILAVGLGAGLVCRWLRISVLVGYLIVGAAIGRGGLGWITDQQHEVEHLAEAGVFLLLFSIGLEFSLDDLWALGRNLFIGGSVQMLCVAIPIALLLGAVGFSWQSAGLIAAAVSFSSTVLVFKALGEWGQDSTPHGRRAIGILLFQDAALVPLLLVVPLMTGTGATPGWQQFAQLLVVSAIFVGSVILCRYLLSRWLIPWFASYRSPELIILFTLVMLGCVTLVAYSVGLPAAIGAFAAGLIFNGNRWTKQIDALVLPFRETFAAIFFVSLGLLLDPQFLLQEPIALLAGLVIVVAIKAVAATVALRLTDLTWQSSIGMGIGLAHVGEFAFVLLISGWEAAVISDQDYQRAVGVALGSLLLTPLLMQQGLRLVKNESGRDEPELLGGADLGPLREALVIGAGPIGRSVAAQLETQGQDVCVVDLSPVNVQPFAQQGFRTASGDATQSTTLEHARAEHASLVVVCIPDDQTALAIVRQLREMNRHATILVRCRYQAKVPALKKAGANQVISEEVHTTAAFSRVLDRPGPPPEPNNGSANPPH